MPIDRVAVQFTRPALAQNGGSTGAEFGPYNPSDGPVWLSAADAAKYIAAGLAVAVPGLTFVPNAAWLAARPQFQ